jgi:glycosyltransferase involved in cell wall biosynthesis
MARLWTINGDFVGLKPTGVPRYAREVTFAIDSLIGEGHPLTDDLVIEMVAPREPDGWTLHNIPIKIVPEYNRPRLPQVWVQLQLPRHVRGGLLSFCNLAPVSVRRQIACIHDLHTFLRPESYGRGFRLAHKLILPRLGRTARFITTVSNLSRSHLIEHGVAPADKIVVTYNGADHAAHWRPEASQLPIGDRPFVLCLGQNQHYKNMRLIWRIAPALDALGLDVYMAGAIGEDVLRSYGGEWPANLRRLGRVSDDDFAKVLRSALCFLFPSRIEGFGLPAIEAMINDCPVIAADAPCLPEICGDAALYAGTDDDAGWIGNVAKLRADASLRHALVAKGRVQAKRYSWRSIADIYLQLMARCDGLAAISPSPSRSRETAQPLSETDVGLAAVHPTPF